MGTLKDRAAVLERNKVKDIDPEDDAYLRSANSDDSGSEEDIVEDAGREHYESVGKSRLREPEQPSLGAKYGGVAVTRAALEEDDDDPFAPVDEDDEDDPFAAKHQDTFDSEEDFDEDKGEALTQDVDDDEEIDSDEALGESDVERFRHMKFRGSKKTRPQTADSEDEELSDADVGNGLSDESDNENESTEASDVDMDDFDEDLDEISSISSTGTPSQAEESTRTTERSRLRTAAVSASTTGVSAPRPETAARNADRAELRRAAESASTAGLASALSAGANADVKKGQAVRLQRQTFDRLLDARIKLQKGIAAMNELSTEPIEDEEIKNAARSAEDAALALWSTIDSIRCSIASAQESTSKGSKPKRKRPLNPIRSTTLTEIWEYSSSMESQAKPHRDDVLDKWHTKTQPILDTAQKRSNLLKPARSPSSRISDVLDTYLSSESASLTSQSYSSSSHAFDDSTFYQALLRDLLSSRTAADSSGALAQPSALPQKLHISGSKHKKVDTKASKGRKIRYTVHEKLQNFMASEDRNTWTNAARAEFFGSLLGNVDALAETEVDGVDEDVEEGVALKLFRS
ncbi:rRNA-processing protein bfr2 [Cladophialophora chaetospira]|uniref:Protein BFR2 n=1 Tax=Cladophialophora chaetospira TaxID=386627 RepID=A0AA38XJZ8_9EURO|nr:rRNA-processing protein bfr2 [Cladophialophora chaetospira]